MQESNSKGQDNAQGLSLIHQTSGGQKQSALKKTSSTENFHVSPKTVRFQVKQTPKQEDESEEDIDTSEARKKHGGKFLLGNGDGS